EGKDSCLVLANDVTEWKEMMEKLREREALFRAIFDSSHAGVNYIDVKGRWIAVNPAMQQMLGYSQNELSGMHFSDISNPEDSARQSELFRQLIAGEINHYHMENRYIRKDDTILWGSLSASLAQDVLDHPRFVIAIVEDITQLKTQAEAMERSGQILR